MTEPQQQDEQWVADTFGDVGEAPSNDVEVDTDAEEAPNVERPCDG